MPFKKAPPKLVKYFDQVVGKLKAERSMMFGYPVYYIKGNLFCGVFQKEVILRMPEKECKKLLAELKGLKEFEPMQGRIIPECICLPPKIYNDKEKFLELLKKSHKYVSSLPTNK